MYAKGFFISAGKIVGRDMKVVLRALGYEPTKDELNKMISDVDKEGLGLLDFNEFLEILLRKMVRFKNGPKKSIVCSSHDVQLRENPPFLTPTDLT